LFSQEKEDFKNRLMELELTEDKQSAQIRELTRLVLSLRDEMHKKNSGFFGSAKKGTEPIPPELAFTDDTEKKKPENVEFRNFDFSQLSRELSPVMRTAVFLSTIKFEEA
jgi:hypothetical protein